MRKQAIITSVFIGAVVLVLTSIVFGSYNGLSGSKNTVDKAWSQVEVSYQRRADLIPNLVAVAKEASVREQEILESALEARSSALNNNVGTGDTDQLDANNSEVTGAIGKLIAISEAYPDLKSNANWLDLQSQLEGTENRIAVARADYNDVVETYNHKIVTLPSAMFAKMFGFEKVNYFASQSGAETPPVLDLN